jgi:hypothetical protein
MTRPPQYLTPKVEDFGVRLDLAWLRRHGARTIGFSGRVRCSYRGIEKALIAYAVVPGGIKVDYGEQGPFGQVPVTEFLPVVSTSTRFGGRRHWFCCRGCRRRCRIVYLGRRFRCRLCLKARYESQYEAEPSRISARRWRIRALLDERGGKECIFGLDDGFPDKPPRMHWTTYSRLRALDQVLSERWFASVGAWLD